MQIMCVDHSPWGLMELEHTVKQVMSKSAVHGCRDPGKAIELARLHGCDILLTEIDLGGPKWEGLDFAEEIKKVKSVPYVSIDGIQLKQNTDYTVTYWYKDQQINPNKIKFDANEEVHEITVKITGKGNYLGETLETGYTVKKLKAQMTAVDLTKAKIYAKGTKKAVSNQLYTGEGLEPEIDVYVKIGKTWTKVDESLYTVTYVNNIERGKARILVNGDGEGAIGSKTGTFKIVKWQFSLLNLLFG